MYPILPIPLVPTLVLALALALLSSLATAQIDYTCSLNLCCDQLPKEPSSSLPCKADHVVSHTSECIDNGFRWACCANKTENWMCYTMSSASASASAPCDPNKEDCSARTVFLPEWSKSNIARRANPQPATIRTTISSNVGEKAIPCRPKLPSQEGCWSILPGMPTTKVTDVGEHCMACPPGDMNCVKKEKRRQAKGRDVEIRKDDVNKARDANVEKGSFEACWSPRNLETGEDRG
ncbi:hypothetical protein K504DRAFT_502868 [Pleomassaria siparia CBS 279.74]|uniref:Extracellular membrane protein CFEM domain-containing protein n=1 Tax=Pleomassaria siparia CBS 279.74 TaxID=1314801 RepID=A0A6G1K8A4_9PLEO|nr:hypothetical protein K504DRAFT_502868 [Pleomassaria siparia CBS 279.74]